jgi:YgiT-type zinc finger domain-containing protein
VSEQTAEASPFICEHCNKATYRKVAQVTLWSGDQLVLVENVPVQICDTCQEQYYDEGTGENILQLASAGFPQEYKVRDMTVPVFRLPPDPITPQSDD